MQEISDAGLPHKGKKKNGEGKGVIDHSQPYYVDVEIVGDEDILFHRYDVQAVEDSASAPKGSKKKKEDNLESYVYRNDKNEIVMPGTNFKASICAAAKFSQDPRSRQKSAKDLFRAGIKVKGDASFGKKDWDFVDARRCVIKQNAISRRRPGLRAGWTLTFRMLIILPEYISEEWLQEVVERAGKTCGLGDFRPDFGTFRITSFKRVALKD